MALSDISDLARNKEGIAAALGILKQRFGPHCQTGADIRRQHAHTTTYIPNQAPDAVVFAGSSDDVVETVCICAEHRVPIIPFGTGTSLEGHVNAPAGGISLDIMRMDRVLQVNAEDLDCVVEPGVTRMGLVRKLEGDPDHPLSQGRLCVRGQAAVQVTYHPDRLVAPQRRNGERGSGQFTEISWDEALKTLVERLDAGNIYVNRNMIGAVVGTQPFGGSGLSGTGFKAGGPHYLLRFALEQVVSVNTAAAGGNASLIAMGE